MVALVTYWERGVIHDFKRVDTKKVVLLMKAWWQGNLLYGYKDMFNVMSISREDIIAIEEV